MHNFARECQSHWRKNLSPHIRYVATIPCESLGHKSNTFHTIISTLHMFISITFTQTGIDETNKPQQKVRGSKFMFKMSIIHANTCIQTTTPLRNRCRDDGSVYSSPPSLGGGELSKLGEPSPLSSPPLLLPSPPLPSP